MSNKLINYLETAGLNWAVPVVRLCRGEDAREQASELFTKVGLPLIAVLVFLLVWSVGASQVKTSLGVLPGPTAVWRQAFNRYDEHQVQRDKADAFYQRQEERNAAKLERNPDAEIKWRKYTGKPTFYDQIGTSLLTVFTGFVLASLIAIPFGALDALTRAHLQDSVMEIQADLNNTVIMVIHDVDEAVLLSDKIVMMTNGPAATVGEVLEVDLARPRDRLALASDERYNYFRSQVLSFLYERQRRPAE